MTINIYKKLQEARLQVSELNLKKTGKNAFGNGFNYFELRDFMPSVNKVFNDIGLIGLISLGDESVARLNIVNIENPEEVIVFSCSKAEAGLRQGTPLQNIGAQSSYLRRYLWIQGLELTEDDAIDALADDKKVSVQDFGKQKQARPYVPKPNDTYPDDLRNAKTAQELGLIWQSIPKMYKVQSLINIKDEMKAKLTPIDQQIREAKTKDELVALCNKLDKQKESEFSQIIAEKLDEFLLHETNGDI